MNKKFNLDNFDLLTDKKASEEEKICSKCKTKNISSAKFCIECGNNTFRKLSSGDRFCVACNIKLDNSDSTCPICGKKEFVDSIEKLISNRVDLQDKKVLVEHSKLEEEVFQLSNSLNFSKMRNEELELYVDRYNKKIEKLKNIRVNFFGAGIFL